MYKPEEGNYINVKSDGSTWLTDYFLCPLQYIDPNLYKFVI